MNSKQQQANEEATEMARFDTLIISYDNGNKDWVSDQFKKMEPAKQERFMDYVDKATSTEFTCNVYYTLLKRMI